MTDGGGNGLITENGTCYNVLQSAGTEETLVQFVACRSWSSQVLTGDIQQLNVYRPLKFTNHLKSL